MQVLCMVASEDNFDVQCPHCHQKYMVYYARLDKAECEQALQAIYAAFAQHHATNAHPSAHPGEAFNIPAWSGPVHASAAALLSGAPVKQNARPRNAPLPFVSPAQQRRVS